MFCYLLANDTRVIQYQHIILGKIKILAYMPLGMHWNKFKHTNGHSFICRSKFSWKEIQYFVLLIGRWVNSAPGSTPFILCLKICNAMIQIIQIQIIQMTHPQYIFLDKLTILAFMPLSMKCKNWNHTNKHSVSV